MRKSELFTPRWRQVDFESSWIPAPTWNDEE